MRAIFLDIETNGLDPIEHRPIEIAFEIMDLTEQKRLAAHHWLIKQPKEVWEQCDPASLKINGFTWDELQYGMEQTQVCEEISAIFAAWDLVRGKSFFICQNPAFDRSFWMQIFDTQIQEQLLWPYHWLDLASMDYALQVKQLQEKQQRLPETFSLSKNAIAARYNLPPEPLPHRAENGVKHLIQCYSAIFGITFQ